MEFDVFHLDSAWDTNFPFGDIERGGFRGDLGGPVRGRKKRSRKFEGDSTTSDFGEFRGLRDFPFGDR